MPKKKLQLQQQRVRLSSPPLSIIGQQAGFYTSVDRARATGIPLSTLRHLERGSFLPSPEVIDKMAEAYGRSIDDIERAARLGRENLLRRQIEQAREMR